MMDPSAEKSIITTMPNIVQPSTSSQVFRVIDIENPAIGALTQAERSLYAKYKSHTMKGSVNIITQQNRQNRIVVTPLSILMKLSNYYNLIRLLF